MSKESEFSSLRLVHQENGVGILVFDTQGESVNTLRADFANEFSRVFDEVERSTDLRALVLTSGKPESFIAGADISMLERVKTSEEAVKLSVLGQRAVERIASCRVPVVAAIHGVCLGGGLEVALACAGRVASLDEKTRLGLPEVQLGILPGMGGTVRLPRVVGLSASLDLLLTGRQVGAKKALKIGLVDEVVPLEVLTQIAVRRALQLADSSEKKGKPFAVLRELLSSDELRELALAENPLGRKVVFEQARKHLIAKTAGNYPAPERILEVVKFALERGERAGLEREAEEFGRLVVSREAAALRHIYFSQQSLKKDEGTSSGENLRRAKKVGVLGAGLMGAGVAYVSAVQAGCSVRLKDLKELGLCSGLKTIDRMLEGRVKRRRMSERERSALLARITRTTEPSLMRGLDVVIEAVFEDLAVKRRVLAEVEEFATGETIFASNTSSLPITEIAAQARFPERVIGMHYFSPVEKMPLLEIIITEKTAPWVIKTCVDLGKRQGKTVIVVSDGPGFYTTRILGPYLNEAAFALIEGRGVDEIDAELIQAGFPIGALTLLDEVGLDVGAHVAGTLEHAFGARVAPPARLSRLVEAGRLGRKNKSGFYDYSVKSSERRPVDLSVYEDLGLEPPQKSAPSPQGLSEPGSVAERCILQMVNEAAHCLGEGIVRSPRDGDIGAIFGLGFPPFLGGPFFFADTLGAKVVVERLEALKEEFGERFEPAPRLTELAKSEGRFYTNGSQPSEPIS